MISPWVVMIWNPPRRRTRRAWAAARSWTTMVRLRRRCMAGAMASSAETRSLASPRTPGIAGQRMGCWGCSLSKGKKVARPARDSLRKAMAFSASPQPRTMTSCRRVPRAASMAVSSSSGTRIWLATVPTTPGRGRPGSEASARSTARTPGKKPAISWRSRLRSSRRCASRSCCACRAERRLCPLAI